MKKTTFVALLLLSAPCFAADLASALTSIEAQWTTIYYKTPKDQQAQAYAQLLATAKDLAEQFPKAAEPIFWQGVIKATYAEQQDPVSALKAINQARDLLVKAVTINPKTADGSAYVTLGTLYYLVPGWPIAFGDNNKARQMFQTALKINPNGIDANYFYGEFLASINETKEAEKYFQLALNAPVRTEQAYADSKLKEEAALSLKNLHNHQANRIKQTVLSLLSAEKTK